MRSCTTINLGSTAAIWRNDPPLYLVPSRAGKSRRRRRRPSINNTKTEGLQVSVKGPGTTSLTYDKNGNLTGDGTNSYKWDAANRMIEIDYSGSGNKSLFAYDGLGRNIQILEYSGGSLTGTKNFIWCGHQRCEQRDASSALIAQYFSRGETILGADYFWTKDRLGSIVEVTNGSGAMLAQLSYDPYGRVTAMHGTILPDFQFAGYYCHGKSKLNLTVTRPYNALLGRFLSRDQIQEGDGPNAYSYVHNAPLQYDDPEGLGPPPCKPDCTDSNCCDEWFDWCEKTGRDPQCCYTCHSACLSAIMSKKPYVGAGNCFDGPCRRRARARQRAESTVGTDNDNSIGRVVHTLQFAAAGATALTALAAAAEAAAAALAGLVFFAL